MSNDPDIMPGQLNLIGQFDSPFVRRVGIALTHAGIAFNHLPWSAFGDARRLRALNPLMRVPTLVLEHGAVLVDSHAMLDHIDRRAAQGGTVLPMRPPAGPERDEALRLEGLAVGLAEKAVSLFYELRLHREVSEVWAGRCREQLATVAAALEMEALRRPSPHWFGDTLSHADIAIACAWRFVREAHPGLLAEQRLLSLVAHCAALEAMPVLRSVMQRFVPPA